MSCKNIPRVGVDCRWRCQTLLLWSLELWGWIYLPPGRALCQFRKLRAAEGTGPSDTFSFLDHGLSQLLRISPGPWAASFRQRNSVLECNFFVYSCMHRDQLPLTVCTGEIAPGHFWQPQKPAKPAAKIIKLVRKKKKKEKKNVEFLIYLSAGLQRFGIFCF